MKCVIYVLLVALVLLSSGENKVQDPFLLKILRYGINEICKYIFFEKWLFQCKCMSVLFLVAPYSAL